MERTPRFSILLPTHNRADVLPFAIRSALWQTESDFELLIAGDGCTDRTIDVIASFQDPRIRWFDLPKAPGIGYANRNAALRHARGRYIAYLAHDDLWFPDHLARLGTLLDQTGADFVCSRLLTIDVDGAIKPAWYNLEIPSHQASLSRADCATTISAVVHTRDCLSKYGYWDETIRYGGDIVMWHRILASGRFQNLAFLSDPTNVHFIANWRRTRAHAHRMRMSRWLLDGLLNDVLPPALRLTTTPPTTTEGAASAGATQQEALWQRLAQNPDAEVRAIRRGVIQFQDALLWKARTEPGMLGLRLGLSFGRMLSAVWRAATWLVARKVRQPYRDVQERTRALEHQLR